jgi:AraC-like DNA-binding protein
MRIGIFWHVKREHTERHHYHEPSERDTGMPLMVVASGSSRWYGTDSFARRHTGFWGIELVTLGGAVFMQDSREYRVRQGDAFLLRPGTTNSYGCDSGAMLHKRYLQIRGAAADRLFETCGLSSSDMLRLSKSQYVTAISLMKHIHAECGNWTAVSPARVSAQAYALLLVLRESAVVTTPQNAYVERAMEWVQRNVPEPVGVRACAAFAGITTTHLNRLIKREIGCSMKQYMLTQKMAAAANLLRETNASVAAVAGSVGFADPLYFSHAFRRHHGRSPLQYRTWIRQSRI